MRMPFLLTADKIDSVADKRLTVDSEFSRGCGGVAILWHKSLQISVKEYDSDCLCVVQLSTPKHNIPIVGVYLLSSNLPLDHYSDYLHQVKECVLLDVREMATCWSLVILMDTLHMVAPLVSMVPTLKAAEFTD